MEPWTFDRIFQLSYSACVIVAHVQNPAEHFESFKFTDVPTLLREIGGLGNQLYIRGNSLYIDHPDTLESQLVNKGDYIVRRIGSTRLIRIQARAYKGYSQVGIGSLAEDGQP